MGRNSLISIIIPVFDRALTLPRLFTSLLGITYRPLEIILVDNGSADHSFRLCAQFQTEYSVDGRSIFVYAERRKGSCAARNLGLSCARGEYVYFFDSDDEVEAAFFTDATPFVGKSDLICAPTVMKFADGHIKRRAFIPSNLPSAHILSATLSTQTMLVRRRFLETVGGWNESLFRWNDWELGIRLLCHVPSVRWLNKRHYHTIYQHSLSISGRRYAQDYAALFSAIKQARTDIEVAPLCKTEKVQSYRALYFKIQTVAVDLKRMQCLKEEREMLEFGRSMPVGKWYIQCSKIFYILLLCKVPAVWRLVWFLLKMARNGNVRITF